MAFYKAVHNLSDRDTGEIVPQGTYIDSHLPYLDETQEILIVDPNAKRGNKKICICYRQGFLTGREPENIEFLEELGAIEEVIEDSQDFKNLQVAGIIEVKQTAKPKGLEAVKANKILDNEET